MSIKIKSSISPTADRMGRFIGQLRSYEGIPLHKLAHGLCSASYLNRIENGEREVGKQMTDAFFQRLGKPVELFERILDWDEFQQWTHRQEIISHLHHGNTRAALYGLQKYLPTKAEVLDQQFAIIIEINCRYLSGATASDLLPMVCDALLLTQPKFQITPIDELLLSQNEGRLLFAYLRLTEQLDGFEAVSESYRALLSYFKKPRYESQERVYLFPYVACQVIENNYRKGLYASALEICDDALAELTKAKRFFAYDRLLEWKQKLFDALGYQDRLPERLLTQVRLIQTHTAKQTELLVPCDERGHVYCLNQVIGDRRKLLGISQETLSEGICEPRTISRIETMEHGVQKKNRKHLLQRVNMSGERYDYEVITDRYEDYLLRSEIDRAIMSAELSRAEQLINRMKENAPDIPTNHQYLMKTEIQISSLSAADTSDASRRADIISKIEDAIHLTLPLDIQQIETWPLSVLSVNEIISLISCAFHYKRCNMYEQHLAILTYVKQCLKHSGAEVSYYEDLYTRVEANIASTLGDLGRYQESDLLTKMCIKLAIENQNTNRLTQYLYGIAWNTTQQIGNSPKSIRKHMEKDAISYLRQAYAAAQISGDSPLGHFSFQILTTGFVYRVTIFIDKVSEMQDIFKDNLGIGLKDFCLKREISRWVHTTVDGPTE